ncbi:EamA/RhaT family transporter, partial [Mesorhizobium sp. M7A.F.Ca.US.014.04.1.1]
VAISNRALQARTSLRTASVQSFDAAPAFATASANRAGDRHPNNSGPVEECDGPCR